MISHDLNDVVSTASAYGELGEIHKLLGNFEQSINCMERRLEMARSVSSWSKVPPGAKFLLSVPLDKVFSMKFALNFIFKSKAFIDIIRI